jgi:hypothetical protein
VSSFGAFTRIPLKPPEVSRGRNPPDKISLRLNGAGGTNQAKKSANQTVKKEQNYMGKKQSPDPNERLTEQADERVKELWRYLGREPNVDANPELAALRREACNLAARHLEDAAGALSNEDNSIDICLVIAVERLACASVLLKRIKQSLAAGKDCSELTCAVEDLEF